MPRLRFSLKTLFLSLLFACLIGSNVFTSYRLKQLHEENVALRKETGRLVVKDPAKLNIVAVPTYEDLTWRWRVHVPPGDGERICFATQQIPQRGYDTGTSSTTLRPGDYLLTATIRRNRHGDWALTFGHPGGNFAAAFNEQFADWLGRQPKSAGWSMSQLGENDATVREPGAKLDLLRLRVTVRSPDGRSSSSPDEPCDGILIWIEDHK